MVAEPVAHGLADSAVAERGPTAVRIAVGSQLRKLRESKNITREAAGDHFADPMPRSADSNSAGPDSRSVTSGIC